MQAGRLNSRITIERQVKTQSEYGDILTEWELVGSFWANVRNVNGKEFTLRGMGLNSADTSIRIRLNRKIDHEMRVVFRGEEYQILAVLHDEQSMDYTDLACRRGLSDGR